MQSTSYLLCHNRIVLNEATTAHLETAILHFTLGAFELGRHFFVLILILELLK